MDTQYIDLAKRKDLTEEERKILQETHNRYEQIKEEIKEKLEGLMAITAIDIIDEVRKEIETDMKMNHVYFKDRSSGNMEYPVTSWDFTKKL